MASILKRTVFYDKKDGIVRFWDWALVTTSLGVMAEPFRVDARHSMGVQTANFDPTDEMSRIDEMKEADRPQQKLILSGGVHQLHGGVMIPRVGR